MKNLILLVVMLEFISLTGFSQRDINLNSKELINMFSYYDHFDSFYYCDDYYGYIYDSIGIVVYNTGNPENIWQVGNPEKGDWTSGYPHINGGNKVLITDTIQTYPTNNESIVELHIVKPGWAYVYGCCWSSFQFGFYFKCDTDSLKDGLKVEVSFDGGQTFANASDSVGLLNLPMSVDSIYSYYYTEPPAEGEHFTISGSQYGFLFPHYLDWVEYGFSFGEREEIAAEINYMVIKLIFKSDEVDEGKRGIMIDALNINVVDFCHWIGIENQKTSKEIKVYPNPASRELCVDIPNAEQYPCTFEMVSYSGQKAIEEEISSNQFVVDISKLPTGVYVYRITNSFGLLKINKLIIN
ncbi:MAG TPA: T9SS type A sorting domain-containing protein [Bacteroidales bacterium]|nr:T9SS type A sorting domain-containing protein [Bacteroidales bacterium]